MSKVIFEFNEEEDRIEIENIMKRNLPSCSNIVIWVL